MRRLIYSFDVSLDRDINDPAGNIDWTDPDDELHQFHNDSYRGIEVSLHGRRLHELMADYWPHVPDTGRSCPPWRSAVAPCPSRRCVRACIYAWPRSSISTP